MFGLDFVTAPSITAMKAASVAFVCRYLSEVNDLTKIKLLTPAEAKADSAAGIALVSNYEWTGTTALGGFNAGVFDAKIAAGQHATCGGPGDRPIYFSVDWDASAGQMGTIGDYFKGVASIIGLARTGVYGSYSTVKYLLDNDLVTWAWQTYAWSGGQWDARADIQQYSNGVTLGGHSVDYDRSMKPDFGQWFYGGTMIPTGWKDVNGVLIAPNNVPVHDGFRAAIENDPAFDPANVPNEAEYNANPVQYHVADSGNGDRQTFRDTVYWWTPKYGVVVERYPGLELDATYKQIAAQDAEIATLKAQLAQAQQPAPVDTSTVESDINAIADAIAAPVAKALADLKKL